MKRKHFYSHLVETSDISLEIAQLDMSADERVHLISLVEANVHSTVIKTVLSELPEEEKKAFLKNLVSDDHNLIWDHLRKHIDGVDKKIKTSLDKLIDELRQDIRQTKNK